MTIQAVPPSTPLGARPEADPRSLGELVVDLRDDVKLLAKQELELAKAELVEKAKNAALGAGFVVGAAVIGIFAFVAFTILLIAALNVALPLWLAALIVTVVYVGGAAFLFFAGTRRFRRVGGPLPTLTMQRIKEDLGWLRRRAL